MSIFFSVFGVISPLLAGAKPATSGDQYRLFRLLCRAKQNDSWDNFNGRESLVENGRHFIDAARSLPAEGGKKEFRQKERSMGEQDNTKIKITNENP